MEENSSQNTQQEDQMVDFPEDNLTPAAEQTEESNEQVKTNVAAAETEAESAPASVADGSEDADAKTKIGTFTTFGFSPEVMRGIEEAGFTEPTPIQAKAMPLVSAGHDVIGQALTGTGKTAAFSLPIINKIQGQEGLNFLVLVPTRELAAQVSGEIFRLGRYTGLKTAAFTGGQSYSRQETLLSHGLNALVATPGRLNDLIESGHFEGINPAHIVVDEADEMLDMGFIEDVRKIFQSFPGPHQTMLFSATMPRPVVQLAEEILNDPVNITTSLQESANNDIEQLFYVIEDSERANAVIRLIDASDVTKAMIFCRTKEETDSLNILLSGRGYNVNCLHGDMEQAARTRVMNAFRKGEIDILVATDVAARGLDVDDVSHVFNYHLPFDSRSYVHRIGRTGRAGKTGTAITLVTPREMRALEVIRRNVGAQMENRLIPTRTQVTEQRLKKLFRELNEIDLDVNLLNQVQTLATNYDQTVLIAKLVSHVLSNGGDQGPEYIGIGGERLDDILAGKPRRRGGRGGDRFERDGGRDGGRRGGGRRGDRERGERRERGGRGDREERGEFRDTWGERDHRPREDRTETAPMAERDFQPKANTPEHAEPPRQADDTTQPAFSHAEKRPRVFQGKVGDFNGRDSGFSGRRERSFERRREDRPFERRREDRPFREGRSFEGRSFERREDRPFGRREDRFSREGKPFGRREDRPFREGRSFEGRSFERREGRSFREDKPFGGKKDRDGRSSADFKRKPSRPAPSDQWYFN